MDEPGDRAFFGKMWKQTEVSLKPRSRGFHLITGELQTALRDLGSVKVGLCHLFIKHTSASLTINENADPDVRADLERHFNVLAPENASHYVHTMEGPDDMPAHIKTVLIGPELNIPLKDGKFVLGTWQGIYLCEHRDSGGSRKIVLTLQGE